MMKKTGELKPGKSRCECGKVAKYTFTDEDGTHAYCEECYEKNKNEITS